ncbi:nitrate ABC transporter substrate-binding protein, partial [Rhizobium ruizarguesonis]
MNGDDKQIVVGRRTVLKGGAFALAAATAGISVFVPRHSKAAASKVVIKYDWLMSNGQIGDIVAVKQGLFE